MLAQTFNPRAQMELCEFKDSQFPVTQRTLSWKTKPETNKQIKLFFSPFHSSLKGSQGAHLKTSELSSPSLMVQYVCSYLFFKVLFILTGLFYLFTAMIVDSCIQG